MLFISNSFPYHEILKIYPFWLFRVEYKQLDKLHDTLMDVPFVGLTATATEKYVPYVICNILNWLDLMLSKTYIN